MTKYPTAIERMYDDYAEAVNVYANSNIVDKEVAAEAIAEELVALYVSRLEYGPDTRTEAARKALDTALIEFCEALAVATGHFEADSWKAVKRYVSRFLKKTFDDDK